MSAPAFPPLESLVLVPATPGQVHQSLKNSHPHWGAAEKYTFEQYLDREVSLAEKEHAGENFTTWVLVPHTDPQTLSFLASCETYRRPSTHIQLPSSPSPTPVTAYGIASVFCPPALRRRGYAQRMLELLHYRLAPPGSPHLVPLSPPPERDVPVKGFGDAAFSVLYSDVGRYYERVGQGWRTTGEREVVWDVEDPSESEPDKEDADLELVTSPEALEPLLEADHAALLASLSANPPPPGSARCAILPTPPLALYLLHRSTHYRQALLLSLPVPPLGAILRPSSTTPPPFILFHPSYSEHTLIILRLRFSHFNPAELARLVRLAKHVARAQGLGRVTAWNVDLQVEGEVVEGGRLENRTVHLPGIAWYHPGAEPRDVEWVVNERFAWC